jgi:hypothetical protein
MEIIIDYESSWRNSFLDGSNNEALPKGGRNFVASMLELKKEGNYIERHISKDTVMGILNRLIGDQRKLYQSRTSDSYYFKDIESHVDFKDKLRDDRLTSEVVYIRNMNGSTDQKSFSGAIKTNDPILSSEYSLEFWGVLALNINELCEFVVDEKYTINKYIELHPLAIVDRLEDIKIEKSVADSGKITEAKDILQGYFPLFKPLNKKGEVMALPLYCSALYLQMQRLSERFDMSSAKTARGGISGISHNGFTVKNIMDRFTTGGQKIIWGNPYMKKEKIKGLGEVTSMLSKASGQLEIIIDVDRQKATEIKQLIENAGVSSFYLGKKGLAYVSSIRV